jgi:succinyl-diaminopimelate desuccinylase
MPHLGENAILKMVPILERLARLDLGAADPLQGPPTLNVGVVRGGAIPNQVPDFCETLVDIRSVAGSSQDQLFERVRAAAQGAEVERLVDAAPVLTDPADPWVRRVFARAGAYLAADPEPRSINYFTDAAILKPALGEPPTVICGPGDAEQAHQTDECVEVAQLDRAVELFEQLARDWCDA